MKTIIHKYVIKMCLFTDFQIDVLVLAAVTPARVQIPSVSPAVD